MKFLLLSLLTILSSTTLASDNTFEYKLVSEGFSDSPRKKFQTAWDNTFMFATVQKNYYNFALVDYGTVSVLFKKETATSAYIGFITAKHVLQANVGKKVKLIKNLQYDSVIDSGESVEEISEFSVEKSETSPTHDLGLLIIKVPLQNSKSLTPLTMSAQCSTLSEGDPLVILGFPAVMQRSARDQSTPIKDPKVIKKRFSEGFFVSETVKNEYGPLVGTTADAMHGNSGGPVIDLNGNLVSVQAAVKYDAIKYFGYERKNYYSAHSWIVDCKEMQQFAKKSWRDFLETLPVEI